MFNSPQYNYLTNKEITEELKYQGAMISKAYRIKSNHEHTSNKILLEFTEKAPLLVQFDGYIQIIMDYKNQVRFCSKCKAWGHHTMNCKNKMRCGNCGVGTMTIAHLLDSNVPTVEAPTIQKTTNVVTTLRRKKQLN
ncbi:hypothetical protein ACJMK2_032958 [Sinanodonta woodiana]|uniref:Uncharacterized protein n=1 Tax=Sinanodonta woodiana TaxID=1069815 RepID=A0ABD3X4V8_SINWO